MPNPNPNSALTAMPAWMVAGTTVTYTRTDGNYPPASGWSLKLYIAGVKLIPPISATVSGLGFVVTIPAATTAQLQPGNYRWEERATHATLGTFVMGAGELELKPNIAAALAADFQTWEERTLPVVEAALSGRLTADLQAYQIHGRAITKIPIVELMDIRERLKSVIRQQKNPGKLGEVRVTFSGVDNES